MNSLRRLHLYLGCFFAPLLVFFVLSGLWQIYVYHRPSDQSRSPLLALLSTIHTTHSLKAGAVPTLTSTFMIGLVSAMAVSLVATIILGLVLAFRLGHGRTAFWCLLAGVTMPLLAVLFTLLTTW